MNNKNKEDFFIIFPNIEAIIFDLDGTLYDKKYFAIIFLLNNLKDIFLIQKERKTRSEIRGLNFDTAEEFYLNFFQHFGKLFKNKKYSAEFLKKWYFGKYMPRFTKILEKYYKARPETENIFDILKICNIKFAVLSDYPFVAKRIKAIGIATTVFSSEYENFCFCSENFGALKPSRVPFDKVAKKLNVSNEKVLVVGDKYDTDCEGAENAEMKFIHATNFFQLF